MALGIYGTKIPASVGINDIDVLYAFSATREEVGDLNLQPMFSNVTDGDFKSLFGADGLYKLRLPAEKFNQLGFYAVMIKPKTIETTLLDCSYVVTNNNNEVQISKKGIVISASQFQKTSSLIGYRIEYFDKNNVKIPNLSRIITSSDLVSVSTNNQSIARGSTTYVLDPNGTALFLTVTPDEPSIISNNASVNIGSKGQSVLISNTFFDAVFLEVEMVDQTLKTLSYALYGPSTRDLETGILTYFNDQNNIYRQFNLFTRKKQFSTGNIDIKEPRTTINFQTDFNKVSQGLA